LKKKKPSFKEKLAKLRMKNLIWRKKSKKCRAKNQLKLHILLILAFIVLKSSIVQIIKCLKTGSEKPKKNWQN
jgi:hypothetical protein